MNQLNDGCVTHEQEESYLYSSSSDRKSSDAHSNPFCTCESCCRESYANFRSLGNSFGGASGRMQVERVEVGETDGAKCEGNKM